MRTNEDTIPSDIKQLFHELEFQKCNPERPTRHELYKMRDEKGISLLWEYDNYLTQLPSNDTILPR